MFCFVLFCFSLSTVTCKDQKAVLSMPGTLASIHSTELFLVPCGVPELLNLKSHSGALVLCVPCGSNACVVVPLLLCVVSGVSSVSCQGPPFTKTPLSRVRAWRFRNISKEYKDLKSNKTEKQRLVPGGHSNEH